MPRDVKGIRRDVLECFVLETLKDYLLHPDLVKEFITAFHAELNAESCNRAQLENQTRKELADVDRRLDGLIHADFSLANLLIHKGDLRVIDFDDCGLGWFLYDAVTSVFF